MSYLEELRKSREKAQVAFHEFALSTQKFRDHLFCFFEGKDNAYYVPRIRQFTDKYHPIKCGGREKVLAVHRLISNQRGYDGYHKAFFIDRDFHEPLLPVIPPIFETPCYSIENLYVSIDTFKAILVNEFGLSAVSDESFDVCVMLFRKRQQEFHQAMCLLNAWYACLIQIRNRTNQKINSILGEKWPKGFIAISLDSVIANYDIETIRQVFPDAPEVTENELNAKIAAFSDCEQYRVFRGKYEMQFLITMIQLLLKDSATKKAVLKHKVNFAFGDASSLNNEQSLITFAGYAETPESLMEYLKKVTNTHT